MNNFAATILVALSCLLLSSNFGMAYHIYPLATPNTTAISTIAKRNPCDGVGARPALYHEYVEADCPAPKHFDTDGTCYGYDIYDVNAGGCKAFCQVRTEFVYATEVPFPKAWCYGPMRCSISESHSVSVTSSVSSGAKVQWGKALKAGVSGGWSWGTSTGWGRTYDIDMKAGECGYFTFIPIHKAVCGTMSTVSTICFSTGYCTCDTDLNNLGNWCQSELHMETDQNGNAEAAGVVALVRVDCNTQIPLDPSYQNPAFNNPGVPLDRGALALALDANRSYNCSMAAATNSDAYAFAITGYGFEQQNLKSDGSGLRNMMGFCSDVTVWVFSWRQDDDGDLGFNWIASGAASPMSGGIQIISVRDCLQSAVEAMGNSTGSCVVN